MEESPELADPTATALLFAIVRQAIKEKHTTIDVDWKELARVVGIRNYKTYKKAFEHLEALEVFEVLERKKNDLTRTLIRINALSENTKASPKQSQSSSKDTEGALVENTEDTTKAIPKHDQSSSHVHTRGSSNKKNNIISSPPNEVEGGVGEGGEGGKVLKFPSLESLVNQFRSDPRNNPDQYPEGFYSEFLTYFESTSEKDETKMVWEVLCKTTDKPLWVKRKIESFWAQVGHRFKQEQRMVVNGAIASAPYKPPHIPGYDL